MLTLYSPQIVEVTLPNLQALSMAHGIAITSEFSSLHDPERWGSTPLEPSTRITLGIGAAVTATELLAVDRLRGWARAVWRNLTAVHRLDA
jgi:hypothetical protein